MSEGAAVSLDALRARIQALEGRRVHRRREPTGVEVLDRLVGGLPQPGLVELHGPPGGGARRLAADILVRPARFGRPVAWVDADRTLYPPALAQRGVDLRYLLVVRPPAGHTVWAMEQLLRSGVFPVVVGSGLERLGKAGPRWGRAVEQGGCTALVVSRHPRRALPADLRLTVEPQGLTVVRDRTGAFGRQGPAAPEPPAADPWQRVRWLRRGGSNQGAASAGASP